MILTITDTDYQSPLNGTLSSENRKGGFIRTTKARYTDVKGTVAHMNAILQKAKVCSCMSDLAMQITSSMPTDAAGFPDRKDKAKLAKVIYRYLKGEIAYVLDPYKVENIQTPKATLKLKQGDCDDMSLLSAALLQSIGIGTRFVLAAPVGSSAYSHIYLEHQDNAGDWLPFDLTLGTFAGDVPQGIGKKLAIYDNNEEVQLGWVSALLPAVAPVADLFAGTAKKQERAAKAIRDAEIAKAAGSVERNKLLVQITGLTAITALAGLLIYKYV